MAAGREDRGCGGPIGQLQLSLHAGACPRQPRFQADRGCGRECHLSTGGRPLRRPVGYYSQPWEAPLSSGPDRVCGDGGGRRYWRRGGQHALRPRLCTAIQVLRRSLGLVGQPGQRLERRVAPRQRGPAGKRGREHHSTHHKGTFTTRSRRTPVLAPTFTLAARGQSVCEATEDVPLDQYFYADLSLSQRSTSWPLASYYYVLLSKDSYTDCSRATNLVDMVWWTVSSKQARHILNISDRT